MRLELRTKAATTPGSCSDSECSAYCTLRAEAAAIPNHTRTAYSNKPCNGFECDTGDLWSAEAATNSGHTRAACCNALQQLQLRCGHCVEEGAATTPGHIGDGKVAPLQRIGDSLEDAAQLTHTKLEFTSRLVTVGAWR